MSDLHIRGAALSDVDAVLAFWAEAAEGTSISDDRDGVPGSSPGTRMRCSSRSGTGGSSGR